jgi:hypothetical protein
MKHAPFSCVGSGEKGARAWRAKQIKSDEVRQEVCHVTLDDSLAREVSDNILAVRE